MEKDLDILMVGHFAKDMIVVDGKEEICPGGAVYYGAVVLKRLGLKVGVASRGNPEDYPSLQPLMDMGIEFDLHPASQSSGCINIYNSADMDHRICKLFGFAGEIPYEDIPDVNAKIIAILPIIAGEVSLDTLIKLSKKAPIALDVQGFVRVPEGDDLLFKPWKDMEEGLKHVTFLKVDSAEAEYLTGEKDLEKAAKILAGYGPKEIVLTQKKEILVYADGNFYRATNNKELVQIYKDIDKLEKTRQNVKKFSKRYEAYQPFAIAAALLMLLEVLLRLTVFRKI